VPEAAQPEPSAGSTSAPLAEDDWGSLVAPSAAAASTEAPGQETVTEETLAEMKSDEFGDFSAAETAQASVEAQAAQEAPGTSSVPDPEEGSRVAKRTATSLVTSRTSRQQPRHLWRRRQKRWRERAVRYCWSLKPLLGGQVWSSRGQ